MNYTIIRNYYLDFYNIDIEIYKNSDTNEYNWDAINDAIFNRPINLEVTPEEEAFLTGIWADSPPSSPPPGS